MGFDSETGLAPGIVHYHKINSTRSTVYIQIELGHNSKSKPHRVVGDRLRTSFDSDKNLMQAPPSSSERHPHTR